jgi:hypothetical protein
MKGRVLQLLRLIVRWSLFVWKVFRTAFRRFVFEQRVVCVYCWHDVPTRKQTEAVSLRELSYGDLHAMSSMYPDVMDAEYLALCSERMARGDRPYAPGETSEIQHIAWLGLYDRIADGAFISDDCVVELPEAQPLIYNCWTPPEFRRLGVYKRVLNGFRSMYPGQPLWIYCRRNNVSSAAGIQAVGFELAYVLEKVIRFGYLSKTRSICAEGKRR